MVEYILGNYMVSKNILTAQELIDTLDKVDKVRVKLGLIAVSQGFITKEQAEEINRKQETCDKRFGDIAVEGGYIKQAQLEKVLKLQGNAYLAFMQALIDQRIIGIGEMENIVEEFRLDNGYSFSDIDALKNDDVHKILSLMLPKEAADCENIIGVTVRTIVRCINRYVSVEKIEMSDSIEVKNAVVQEMNGDRIKGSAFAEIDGGLKKVASGYAREDFEELDEDALDAAAEFLNCINGLFASEEPGGAELMPPVIVSGDDVMQLNNVCRVTIIVKDKKLDFIITK
jgi:CheY-specific phosphatase CheX